MTNPFKAVTETMPKPYGAINWEKVEHIRQPRFNPLHNAIKFRYVKPSKFNKVQRAQMWIGSEIVTKLGWNINDYIVCYQNPDDEYHLMLIKSDNGQGAKLSKVGGKDTSKKGLLNISFPLTCPHDATKKTEITFDYWNETKLIVVLPRS
jgi:hypothetical protein